MVAKPEEAVVIFAMRPTNALDQRYWLMDGSGRCLGALREAMRIVARFPPGEHAIATAVSGKSMGARIAVRGGLTYLVEVKNTYRSPDGFSEQPFVGRPAGRWTEGLVPRLLHQSRKQIFTADEAKCADELATLNVSSGPAARAMVGQLMKTKPAPILEPDHGGVWKE